MSINYELKKMNYLKNYEEVCSSVYKIVKSVDNYARIFVFGSVLSGKITASSDIDILILLSNKSFKDTIYVSIFKNIDAPVEIHFIDNNGYSWYKRFSDNITEILS